MAQWQRVALVMRRSPVQFWMVAEFSIEIFFTSLDFAMRFFGFR